MTRPQCGERRTRLDTILASLESAKRSPDGVAPPAAMLWTDADAQWRSLLPALRGVLPYWYSVGTYDSQNHAGPAEVTSEKVILAITRTDDNGDAHWVVESLLLEIESSISPEGPRA